MYCSVRVKNFDSSVFPKEYLSQKQKSIELQWTEQERRLVRLMKEIKENLREKIFLTIFPL